jgi:twitching motility protein PilU
MALLKLVRDGDISQEEALANADSATNLLWLLNNAPNGKGIENQAAPTEEASFTTFTLST